jgi:hypothetical protein
VPSEEYTHHDIRIAFLAAPSLFVIRLMMLALQVKAGQFVVTATVLLRITAGLLKAYYFNQQ